jgi:hypothetical protein
MAKRRSRKRYSDPYGKNRPLKAGQVRCEVAWCNAAVWNKSVQMVDSGKLVCPNCYSDMSIRAETKDWDIVITKHDIDQRG